MKFQFEGFLYLRKYPWETEWTLDFGYDGMDEPSEHRTATYIKIGPHTLMAEVPDDIDLLTPQIDQIKAQMHELRAKSEAALAQMQERINSLLAIEHKVAA